MTEKMYEKPMTQEQIKRQDHKERLAARVRDLTKNEQPKEEKK